MNLIIMENANNVTFSDGVTFIDSSDISPCNGCAGCWVKTPGYCVIDDKASKYASKLVNYDTVTFISKLCYGGVSYRIKRIIDRAVGYLGTFMTEVEGDVRHEKRYEHNFHLNAIFYGNGSDEEKAEACSLIADMCKNYYITSHTIEFVSKFETAFVLLGGKKLFPEATLIDQLDIPKHKNTEKPKNSIAIINASPRGKKSASEYYPNKIVEYCTELSSSDVHIDKFYWTGTKKPLNGSQIMQFTMYDSIIFCFGVYVDSPPSHLIENLQRIEEYLYQYMKSHTYGPLGKNIKDTKIYAVSNNGLIHGSNSKHSISTIKYFAQKNGFTWVQGIGIGAGPLYSNPNMDVLSSHNSIEVHNALLTLCNNILHYNPQNNYHSIFTDGYLPLEEYKNLLNSLWKKALEKNSHTVT